MNMGIPRCLPLSAIDISFVMTQFVMNWHEMVICGYEIITTNTADDSD